MWIDDNKDFDDEYKFIIEILFAPGTATHTVKYLQDVFQADAAHLQYGKYTFYSSYGSTANSNASQVLIAFGIMFGNRKRMFEVLDTY